MSMWPDDPETGEAQAHKNALCTSPRRPPPPHHLDYPYFYPSLLLSLILAFSLYFPSITSLPPSHAGGGGPQLSDVLGGCVRLQEVTAAIFS